MVQGHEVTLEPIKEFSCNICGRPTEDNLCDDCALWLWDVDYNNYDEEVDDHEAQE